MPISIKPESKGGRAAALGGGGAIVVAIAYLIIEILSGSQVANPNQATVDAKQDMAIEQNKAAIAEGKSDRKAILHTVIRMDRRQAVIDDKLERIERKLE
jgi:hypothetical protein